ncbi:MAG: transcriptional regulator [Herbinix sp.]|jgi:predicted DNA-binding transcriptional regulator YafY|nr:transcriptional regulator [Herbinix sp.]
MKTDRLLEIIIYLLNHENVSAKKLAEHFNVSARTIQRDMISISLAGIPVYAAGGKKGGYSILQEYKMNSQSMKPEEYQLALKALKSLATSYSDYSLDSLIEKYNTLAEKKDGQAIYWDFGVTKENNMVQEWNAVLKKAIEENRIVKFRYRSANGEETCRTGQPLAIHYKWYAWYLFLWSFDTPEYRTCKVARIQDLIITDDISQVDHGSIEERMKESEQTYYRTCISVEIHFFEETISLMTEYFPDCKIEKVEEKEYKLHLNVPKKERLWKALLLSFGDKVWVVSPAEYRDELIQTALKFLDNYDI